MRWDSEAAVPIAMAVALLLALAWPSKAQQPPETHPADIHVHVEQQWDRAAPPGDIAIGAPRTLLAYEQSGAEGYGNLFLACASATDAATGRCPVDDTHQYETGVHSRIPLRFIEARSGARMELIVVARLQRVEPTIACSLDHWSRSTRFVWSSASGPCLGSTPVGTGVTFELPAAEAARLAAGHWTATLELSLRRIPGQVLASHTATFRFIVTDRDAVAIYFPEFDRATPDVGLGLRYNPITREVGGRVALDMCLYDGLGSHSAWLGLTLSDTTGRTPGAPGFSAWHDDGGTDDSQRLDYQIEVQHAGTTERLANGIQHALRGIDSARLRPVQLPGMVEPVYCVPTPLMLTTPPVPIARKRPGYYRGALRVELHVPAALP